jgi:hypothetical protein
MNEHTNLPGTEYFDLNKNFKHRSYFVQPKLSIIHVQYTVYKPQ